MLKSTMIIRKLLKLNNLLLKLYNFLILNFVFKFPLRTFLAILEQIWLSKDGMIIEVYLKLFFIVYAYIADKFN